MKRFFSILIILLGFTNLFFAQEAEESPLFDESPAIEEDTAVEEEPAVEDEDPQLDEEISDVYVYDTNGAGDQFLKISLGGIFPLNFKKQLNPGGAATLGYYRFLSKNIAVGGEFGATYNLSIGEKVLIMIPFTFGIMYQPYINKFEFPLYAEIGFATQTWQSMEIFPTFAAKLSAGVYYRVSDSVSLGASSDFLWIPQLFARNPSKNFNGLFQTVNVGLRYHF